MNVAKQQPSKPGRCFLLLLPEKVARRRCRNFRRGSHPASHATANLCVLVSVRVCVCVASVFCIAQQHKQTPVSLSLSPLPRCASETARLATSKDVARYQWTTSPTELRVRLQTLLVGSPEPLSTEHMAVSILADLRCASCDDGLTHPSSLGHIARPQCNMLE